MISQATDLGLGKDLMTGLIRVKEAITGEIKGNKFSVCCKNVNTKIL